MTVDDNTRPGFSLKCWSRRKLETVRGAAARTEAPAAPSVAPVASPAATTTGTPPTAAVVPRHDLPAPESLTFDSDFAAFLQPKVDESLKRQALKKLFGDPRFNIMDGLDVYIDDYSQPDPLPPGMLEQLVQGRYLFDPPRTRVNDQGFVEDVPPEAVAADAERGPVAEAEGEAATGEASATSELPPVPADAASGDPGAPGDAAAEPVHVSAIPPRQGPVPQ